MPSWLSPQWFCGNSCTWVHVYYAHLASYIYIMLILRLWDMSILWVVDHLWPLVLCSLLSLLSTLWFIGTSNVMYNHTSCTQVHELPQSKKNITILENERCYFKHSHIKYSSTLLTYQVIAVSALFDKCTIISMTTLGY